MTREEYMNMVLSTKDLKNHASCCLMSMNRLEIDNIFLGYLSNATDQASTFHDLVSHVGALNDGRFIDLAVPSYTTWSEKMATDLISILVVKIDTYENYRRIIHDITDV